MVLGTYPESQGGLLTHVNKQPSNMTQDSVQHRLQSMGLRGPVGSCFMQFCHVSQTWRWASPTQQSKQLCQLWHRFQTFPFMSYNFRYTKHHKLCVASVLCLKLPWSLPSLEGWYTWINTRSLTRVITNASWVCLMRVRSLINCWEAKHSTWTSHLERASFTSAFYPFIPVVCYVGQT